MRSEAEVRERLAEAEKEINFTLRLAQQDPSYAEALGSNFAVFGGLQEKVRLLRWVLGEDSSPSMGVARRQLGQGDAPSDARLISPIGGGGR